MSDSTVKTITVAAAAGASGALLTALGAVGNLTSVASVWPVTVTCAIVAGLAQHTKLAILAALDNRAHTLRSKVDRMQRDLGDIHGLARLQPYTRDLPLPMGGGWALTGDSAALLVRETLLRQPKTVVELGSGVSTLLLGQVFRQLGGGRVLSIDHDPVWAERTRRQVRFLGIEDQVTVVVAPLRPALVKGRNCDWYDLPTAALDDLGAVDLLLVDGPPQLAGMTEAARFPALPQLASRLSRDAWIFVDDAKRSFETTMVTDWQRLFPDWSCEHHDTVDGVTLMSRSASKQERA